MSTFPELLAAKEALMKEHGVPLESVLDKADIHRTTWSRWKARETSPRLGTWLRVERVIDEAIKAGAA